MRHSFIQYEFLILVSCHFPDFEKSTILLVILTTFSSLNHCLHLHYLISQKLCPLENSGYQ